MPINKAQMDREDKKAKLVQFKIEQDLGKKVERILNAFKNKFYLLG